MKGPEESRKTAGGVGQELFDASTVGLRLCTELRVADAGEIGDRNTAESAEADRARGIEVCPEGVISRGESWFEVSLRPVVADRGKEVGCTAAADARGEREEEEAAEEVEKGKAAAEHDMADDLDSSAVEDRERPADSPT